MDDATQAINDAIAGLEEPKVAEVADLDKSLYHKWTGYDAEATIADPDDPNCAYSLNTSTDCIYGNGTIDATTANQYADLGEWDYLTIVMGADNLPRLFFNQAEGGQNIVRPTDDANYIVKNEDGVIIIDLAAYKEANSFVHLNSIKSSAWGQSTIIEEMKLATVSPYIPAPKYDITIAAGIENGSVAVKGGATKAAAGDEVTLTNSPDVNYEFVAYSVSYVAEEGADPTAVEVSEGGVFVMPAFPVTVSGTFQESANPIELDDWFVNGTFVAKDYGNANAGKTPEDYPNGSQFPVPAFKAETDGNGYMEVVSNVSSTDYNSQLFMEIPEELRGGKVEISMRVQASKAVTAAGQLHTTNNGSGWTPAAAPSVDFTVGKWTDITVIVDPTAQSGINNYVLNLTKSDASVIYMFDDITFGAAKDDWYYTMNFAAKDYSDPSAVYNDEEPNPAAPWDATEGAIKIVSNAKKQNTYESQFFIQIADVAPNGKLNKNDQVILKFKARFESENTELAEVSLGPGFHRNYNGNGWLSNLNSSENVVIPAGADWTPIEKTIVITNAETTNYSLDLTYDAAPITYYFDDFEAEFVSGYEDWYVDNNITVVGAEGKAPYIFGTGAEGGYVEVAGGKEVSFEIPAALRGAEVEIGMKVKASAAAVTDDISFSTTWAEASVIFDATSADAYVLALPAEGTFDFDEVSFKKYFAPVEYGDLVEIPVEGTLVKAVDFTTATSFSPGFGATSPAGYSKQLIVGEGLEIVNDQKMGMWEPQFFIMEGFNLVGGKDYAVRYTLKYQGDGGDMQINLGDWGNNMQYVQALAAGPIYTHMVQEFPSFKGDANGAHVFFQSGDIAGRMIVEKVEVFDITPNIDPNDYTEIIENGTIDDADMSEFIVKDPDEVFTNAEQRDKFGATGVTGDFGIRVKTEDVADDAQAHAYQFFVRLPYALPAGTKYVVSFDYRYNDQEKSLAVATQAQEEPGDYLGNMFGDVNFTNEYASFEKAGTVSAAQDGMRSIAFNLSGNKEGKIFRFDNVSVKVLKTDVDALAAYTADWDAVSASKEPLKDAIKAGKAIVEEEGFAEKYTAESAQALTDALALGATANIKIAAALADADTKGASIQAMENATKDINDAIAGLTISEDYYIPMPDLTENFVKVPETPAVGFGNTAKESGEYDGDAYTNYIATGTSIAFKMLNEDVTGCDKIYIYLAQPLKAGWNIAFWGVEGVEGVKALEAGTEVIEFDLTEELGGVSAVKEENGKTLLKEITLIYLWGAQTPLEAKVYGVYKHLTDEAVGIAEVDDDATETKARKYIENGQIVIVKDGKKYNAAGVEIE